MNNYYDRSQLKFYPLAERANTVHIATDYIKTTARPNVLSDDALKVIRQTARDIVEAKQVGASRMLTFGTHLIHNGLGPLVGEFVRNGWLTHLATTGTSIVDDWDFAFQGAGCENGRENLPRGTYGMWQETDYYLNLAVLIGAWQGLGLGESISRVIADESLVVPERELLYTEKSDLTDLDRAAAAADLLEKLEQFDIKSGEIRLSFPYKKYSLLHMAHEAGIPLTLHPMFGLDVPFMHPLCSFAAVGRAAEKDFLYFTANVNKLENGVYLSVGSSIASPMIFEKALSMSQNVRIAEGRRMTNHKIVVVDLAPSKWNWMKDGEPPETRPEYYLRYCKSFSRAKAKTMYYVSADSRDFFLQLYKELVVLDA